jgi:hypothetical protein
MKRKSTVLIFALLCMILLCANAHAASYTLSTGGVITV